MGLSATEIGVNLPWFGGAYGHDLGPNLAYPDWPVWYSSTKVSELLEFVRSFGIRLVRIWLFEEGEGIDAEGRLDEVFLRNLCDLVERIGSAGVQVYWTLFDANGARGRDLSTTRILTEPAVTRQFASHALAAVAPVIKDVAWAIDLCNEPEAIVKGDTGNWTRSGWKWPRLRPSLAILRESVAALLPGVRVSIGSGYHDHRNLADGVYDRLDLNLDFLDFHLYIPLGEALACPRRTEISSVLPVVLGEIGCIIPDEDRGSEQTWTASQTHLAAHMEAVRELGYAAVFPWYINDPDAADATGLVFRGQAGVALRALSPLRNV